MLQNPLRTFEHKFYYSMNDRDDAEVIPDFYAQNIENWLLRNVGQLEMRDGLTARGSSPSQTNLGGAVLYKYNGTKKLLRVINGSGNSTKFQHSEDGSTWTDVSGGGSRTTGVVWVFVQANQFIYGVNGTDTPIKYDGDTISTVSAIPNGKAIEWWKNRLWVFAVTAVPDRLYFSGASDPETYGGSDFINVNLGDQSTGVGLKGTPGSSGRLYVGKARSWWYITGSSGSDFALNNLTYEFGLASHEATTQVGNEVWAVDLEGNIRKLYRTDFDVPFGNLASAEIQSTIAGLNKAAIAKATATYFNNFALFFVANGVDDYNSLVLVWDTLCNDGKGGWMKFTNWRIARAIVFNETTPKLFLHDSRTGNGQTYQWTGTSDNGQSITAKYETKIYNHGFPERVKVWRFGDQFANAIGNVTSRFYTSIDRYYYSLVDSPSLLGTGNKLLGVDWTLGTDKLGSGGIVKERVNFSSGGSNYEGYSLQVKLEAESSTTKIKLRAWTAYYRIRGLR